MKLNLSIIIGIILIITAIICYVVRGDIESIIFGSVASMITLIIFLIEFKNTKHDKKK
jgi:hypothetical protein